MTIARYDLGIITSVDLATQDLIRKITEPHYESEKMSTFSAKNLAWLVGYLAAMAMIVWLLSDYRANAIDTYGTEKAQGDWEQWREDAENVGQLGSVQRSKPASLEPPSLVLMRDHFGSCVAVSLVLTSCLYVWLMVCVRGVFKPVSLNQEDIDP